MSDEIRVDIGGLHAVEPRMRQLAASVDGALTRLAGVLDGAGPCWGGDEIGSTFAAAYLPGARLVRDALASLRDDVAGVGAAITAVADGADAADDRAQARLS